MSYFNKIKLTENKNCIKCPDKIDDSEHILFGCDQIYQAVLQKIDINEPKDLYKIFDSSENIKTFKTLAKTIHLNRHEMIQGSIKPKNKSNPIKSLTA